MCCTLLIRCNTLVLHEGVSYEWQSVNALIICKPSYPPRAVGGKGGGLTKQVIKYPTIWAYRMIKSSSK